MQKADSEKEIGQTPGRRRHFAWQGGPTGVGSGPPRVLAAVSLAAMLPMFLSSENATAGSGAPTPKEFHGTAGPGKIGKKVSTKRKTLSPLEKALQRPSNAPAVSDITADRMELDLGAHVARFDGHVQVMDPRMTVTADTMIVTFDENNQLKKLEALGKVKIRQMDADREAMAGHAVYDVKKGAIELSEDPVLRNGTSILSGADKIIYYRDSDRIETRGGQPHIRILPKAGKTPAIPNLLDKINKPGKKDK